MTTKTRSAERGVQADLFGGLPPPRPVTPSVRLPGRPPGARQGPLPPARAGGGSRPICTGSGAAVGRSARGAAGAAAAPADPPAEDPRLAELRALGLSHVWLRVAEVIGFDAWLQAWEVMATDDAVVDDRRRVYVPPLESFMRYQRNLVIRSMAESGASVDQILQRLRADFRESWSRKYLLRMIETVRS